MSAWTFESVAGPFKRGVAALAWDGCRLLAASPGESQIVAFEPGAGAIVDFRRYTGRVTGIAVAGDGRLYATQWGSRRVVCLQADGSTTIPCEKLNGRIHNHPADLTAGPSGEIWFSDRHSERPSPGQLVPPLDHASVLVLERDASRHWTLRRGSWDTSGPGAIQISRDGSVLYVAENPPEPGETRELRAYSVTEHGVLGPYQVLLAFRGDGRGPHPGVTALTLTDDGRLVVAVGGIGVTPPSIWVLSPDGLPDIVQPAPEPIAGCAFGGVDGSDLYLGGANHIYRVRATGLRGWFPFRLAPPGVVGRPDVSRPRSSRRKSK